MKIYTLGEEILREKVQRVTEFNQELKDLIDDMFIQMNVSDGVGLAAPQVGVNKRLFVIDAEGQKLAFINPEIISTSEEISFYEEGCLSIPGVYETVVRPKQIEVIAQDVNGRKFRLKADNFLSRVIQHENDHLNGVLFIDRLDNEEKQKVIKKYNKLEKKRKRWRKK